MLDFNGTLTTSVGLEPTDVRGCVQHLPENAARPYSGWFRIEGLTARRTMAADEFHLDIADGPCLKIKLGEADHGMIEFESVGGSLRPNPAGGAASRHQELLTAPPM